MTTEHNNPQVLSDSDLALQFSIIEGQFPIVAEKLRSKLDHERALKEKADLTIIAEKDRGDDWQKTANDRTREILRLQSELSTEKALRVSVENDLGYQRSLCQSAQHDFKIVEQQLLACQLEKEQIRQLAMRSLQEVLDLRREDEDKNYVMWVGESTFLFIEKAMSILKDNSSTQSTIIEDLGRMVLGFLKAQPLGGTWDSQCVFCCESVPSGSIKHKADCPVTLASKLGLGKGGECE